MCANAAKSPRGVDADDQHLAVRHRAPLLITASSTDAVVAIARGVHVAAFGACAPLVKFRASSVSCHRERFVAELTSLMHAARGGSILVTDIEQLPYAAQHHCIEFLEQLRQSPFPSAPRLMSGTTVSLLRCVRAGRFSEELLYRLNVIHLVVRDGH